MVPNPAPVGEEPTSQVLEGQVLEGQVLEGQVLEGQVPEGQVLEGQVPEGQVLQSQVFRGQPPPGLPLAERERMAARGATQGLIEEGLGGRGPEATPAIAAEAVVAADLVAVGDGCATQPMVRRIEAGSVEGGEARAHQRIDALSAMPRPPLLDAGIEVAWRPAPPPETTAAAAAPAEPAAAAEPEPSAHARGIAADRSLTPAPQDAPARASLPAKGMEPLASALDVAVRLAADASVAADALENLNRLLQHKQQLEGLRSAHGALARPAEGAEVSAVEAQAPAPPVLPPLPLPVLAGEGLVGSNRLPFLARQRPSPERRGLDVRGFMAGFALSWAFGVVLYFFMTAG